jgi:anti-anti-sigma factor
MLETAALCALEVERGPDWLLVRVHDVAADPANLVPLGDQIWQVAQQHFVYRIVLELDEIGFLTSHIIGQLIELSRRMQEHDGVLRLCGLSPANRHVLQVCALEQHFAPYARREDAMAGCTCDPRLPR